MKFVGKGQPLTRAGLNKALALLGLGVNDAAYVWTVVEVETAGLTQGFGFRVDRRPQILFDRHMFRKYEWPLRWRGPGRLPGRRPGMVYSLNNTPNWKKRSRFMPGRSSVPSQRLNRPRGAWVR